MTSCNPRGLRLSVPLVPVHSFRTFLLVALLAGLLPALHLEAQESLPESTFTGRAQVTAVDLVIDVRDADGRTPADLSPADFEVYEDGERKPVVAVEPFLERAGSAPAPLDTRVPLPSAVEDRSWSWHNVVYVDHVLSGTATIRRATQTLAAQAGTLTRLGTVEIVVADPHPRQVLPATASARLVEQKLLELSRDLAGLDAVQRNRRSYASTLLVDREVSGRGQGSQNPGADAASPLATLDRANLIWSTVLQEEKLLREQHDNLLAWAASDLSEGPRSLLLVSDGFDLDPRDFYLEGVEEPSLISNVNSLLQAYSPLQRFSELTRVLAAEGWVVTNLALGNPSSSFNTMGADISGKGRMGDVGGRMGSNAGGDLPDQLFYRPLDGLRDLARQTGGEMVTGRSGIAPAIERLAQRVRLTYQVERLPDGELHRVEVRPVRPGLEVQAREWSGSPAPEAASSARARRLLEGGVEKGDLPVVAAVGIDRDNVGLADRSKGTLQARVDLSAFGAGTLPDATNLRVTFAVALRDQLPFVRHDLVEGQSLAGLEAWTYTVPVSFPQEVERVSVVVEDLTTGSWGGSLASQVEGPLPEIPEGRHVASVTAGGGGTAGGGRSRAPGAEEQGYDLPVDLLPDAKVIVLIPPPGEMVTGGARFETLVTRPGVGRVEFYVDGTKVETAGRAPFSARLDLGDLPRPRTIEAVALDAAGEELGRDSVVVNEGAGTFRVRLIEPRRPDRMGPVDVEAEVRVPPDRELDRVEIAWNDDRVATLYAPPFRQRVLVPPESPVGFIGVTAHLADGSTAEDVIFMNGPGGDERVEVELVELFTVVTDPDGRPIQGLDAADFRVFEDGRPQEVAALRPGTEMPLSLGLLLDSSASMAESLQPMQIAALDFLFLTLEEQDRAFYVDFDSEPRLAQSLTSDLQAVGRQVVRAKAGGYTALCDALVYSLVQMQSVKGRRALVIFSDGAGREERVGYATCLRVAQQVGVPIYALILDRDGTERNRSAKVEEIAEAVGGRVFYVDTLDNLGSVYRRIREELESQYVLTYYPQPSDRRDRGPFRRVGVEVLRPGLDARTVAGYWP